jgi:hypothetical protein
VRAFCSAHFSLRVSRRRAFYQTFQVSSEETQGRLLYDLGNRQWEFTKPCELFHEITARGGQRARLLYVVHVGAEDDFRLQNTRVIPQLADKLIAVPHWHEYVREDQIGTLGSRNRQGICAVRGLQDSVISVAEQGREVPAAGRVVVNGQDCCRDRRRRFVQCEGLSDFSSSVVLHR